MFGYICPDADSLPENEREDLKRYYCGLCHAVSGRYTRSATAALSNDCVFLYILFSSLDDCRADVIKNTCRLPGKKSEYVYSDSGAVYAAAVNVILACAKAEDDVRDEGGMKNRFKLMLMKRAGRKAERDFPETAELVRNMMDSTDQLEKSGSSSLDELSHSFASMFGRMCEAVSPEKWEALYELGYNIGRYVYIMDAFDDFMRDAKSGEYNVLVRRCGGNYDEARSIAEFNLFISLDAAKKAFDRLGITKNRGILENILTLGLAKRAETVLKGEHSESV